MWSKRRKTKCFRISLQTPSGEQMTQRYQTHSLKSLITTLTQKNQRITAIVHEHTPAPPSPKAWHRFIEALNELLTAHYPLDEALEQLKEQRMGSAEFIESLINNIRAGNTLSQSLRLYFPNLPEYKHLCLSAGESAGKLPDILALLYQEQRQQNELKRLITQALAYPALLLISAIFVLAGFMIFLLPEFESLYQSSHTPLPPLTRTILQMGNALTQHPLQLLARLLPLALLLKFRLRHKKFNEKNRHRWLRLMALQLNAGIPLERACRNTAGLNTRHTHHLKQIARDLRGGESLHQALERTQLLPKHYAHRLRRAENTGQLAETFTQLANHDAARYKNRLRYLSRLLEPAIMIGIALLVGVLMVALYLPLFQLGTAL